MGLTWFLLLLPVPKSPVHGAGLWPELWAVRLRFLVFALPFLTGLVLSFWAERRFRRGYLDDVWKEAQLTEVLALLSHKVWGWSGLGLVVVCMAVLLFRGHSAAIGGIYLLILPSQMAQRLRMLITPNRKSGSGLSDWRNLQPLQSEHWGQQ